MRRVLCVLLLGGCWSAAPPPATIENTAPRREAPRESRFEHWVGTGHQYDDGSSWEIDLRFDPGAAIGAELGTIAYPSLGCTGVLTREPDRDDDLIAREHITKDPQHRCVDGGEMVIPPERGLRFHWRWRFPESGEEDADATLDRVR